MKREQFENAMNDLDDKYIEEAAGYRRASKRGRIIRIGSLAACAVIVLVGVVGLISGGKKNNSGGADYYYEGKSEMESAANWSNYHGGDMAAETVPATTVAPEYYENQDSYSPAPEREDIGTAAKGVDDAGSTKIIYSASINLESQNFDSSYEAIQRLVSETGGYLEENSVYDQGSMSRSASLTIRLPQDQFQYTVERLKKICHVTYANQSADNVSEQYYDIESRLKTAKIKLERLQALLAEATEMSDIIELENAISNTEWEIDYLSGDLRHYDSLISYSTIRVNLEEVQVLTDIEPEPTSFGARIKEAFTDGLDAIGDGFVSFVLWFVSNLVWIVLIAAAVIISVVMIKKKRKENRGV